MPQLSKSLWQSLARTGFAGGGQLWASDTTVALPELASASALDVPLDGLRGRSILLWTSDQITAALALIEIDGIARRLVLCPPDTDAAHLPYVVATADVDVVVTDRPDDEVRGVGVERIVRSEPTMRSVRGRHIPRGMNERQWWRNGVLKRMLQARLAL